MLSRSRALLDALNDYAGAVILITHDRSLVELAADRLWLTADGTVTPFDGDMDDYAKLVLDRARAAARAVEPEPEPEAAVAPPPPVIRGPKTPTGPARRRAEAAEAALARATRALEEIDAALLDPKMFADPQKAGDLARRRAEAHQALTSAEQAWLEAAEALEAVQVANG